VKQVVILLFLSLVFSAGAQLNSISFINYNVEDGLCDNQVTSVAQDTRGYIWIGTQGGFNRFDGFGFKKFFPTQLINNQQITDITTLYFESEPDVLLVRLGNSQAYTFNAISQKLNKVKSLVNFLVFDFVRLNTKLIAAAGLNEAYLLDNELNIVDIIRPPLMKKEVVVNLRLLGQNRFLIYSGTEFFEYKSNTKVYRTIPIRIGLKEDYNIGFSCPFVDQKRKHIFLNNYFTGLYKLDYNGNIVSTWMHGSVANNISPNPTKFLPISTKDNLVWISGAKGISLLDLETDKTKSFHNEKNTPFSLPADYVSTIFLDKNEILWACTNQGISRQNRYAENIRTWDLGTTVDNPLMNLIKTKNGDFYAVVYFGGLYQIKNRDLKPNQIKDSKLNGSWFVIEDKDNLIQGGEGTNLKYYNKNKGTTTESSILVPYFKKSTLIVMGHKSKNGDLWFSGNAGGGLVRINKKTGKIQHFSRQLKFFSDSYFTICKEQNNGDLWFSSNKSQKLLHWDLKKEKFREIDFEPKFKKLNFFHSVINCHIIDNKGNIWIGFDGTGLVKYNVKTDKIDLYTKNQGLPHNVIYNLIFDHKNRLWVGTKKGLSCLNTIEKSIHNFNKTNGFPTESFETSCSYMDSNKKQLWIASNELLLRFNPDQILQDKKEKMKVFVDEFIVNKVNRFEKDISHYFLSPKENNLLISFSALNLQRSNEAVFSYKLEGANQDWIDLGSNNSTNLVNLRSGDYVFHLRAKRAGESKWAMLHTPIYFTIATPWYLSWWFMTICVLAIILVIYILVRSYFVRKIEQQKSKIEQQKAVQKERDRIAFDMHDDLGSGLTKISYLSQMAISKTQQSEELAKINKTSLELVENMSELIWAMKGENDSLQDLVTYLKLYAVEYVEFNKLNLTLSIPENLTDRPISGESRRNIFLLFKEALHNIVKHANATKVDIELKMDEYFFLTISDNGIGFEPNSSENSPRNGLRNMRKRTESLNGTFEITNKNGTILSFTFPLKNL
jgi:signal transduction histidine kinase/ligand-binding sensor domain-containing protein